MMQRFLAWLLPIKPVQLTPDDVEVAWRLLLLTHETPLRLTVLRAIAKGTVHPWKP